MLSGLKVIGICSKGTSQVYYKSMNIPDPVEYKMIISRNTVDKLGIKMYDRVSAVIAELVSNSYDADAEKVIISGPMNGKFLADREGGVVTSKDVVISVKDDGHGMTPQEMQSCFLVVGRDRRKGGVDRSPKKKRKVMGRKGVGKLAPFGICKTIEIISSGGNKIPTEDGDKYLTSHIILILDEILKNGSLVDVDQDEPYKPKKGEYDNTLRCETGTEIILRNFEYKKMLKIDEMANQLAQRFGIKQHDWSIELRNTDESSVVEENLSDGNFSPQTMIVGEYSIPCKPSTKIVFETKNESTAATINDEGCTVKNENNESESLKAGFYHEGRFYPVSGWIGYSKDPYKDDLMAGIRIYCRGKIAAQTALFNCKSGFQGEYSVRSYLVGELHADWLDEENDLVITDRRNILWSHEIVADFEKWGQDVVKYVAKKALDPVKKEMEEAFYLKADFETKVQKAYPQAKQKPLVDQAKRLCKVIGGSFSPQQLQDPELVDDLANLCLIFAPHVELEKQMQNAAKEETTLKSLVEIIKTAKIAEYASLGKLAKNRIEVIKKLESLKDKEGAVEDEFQKLIESAIWLINPQWANITCNNSLNNFKIEFEKFYNSKNPDTPICIGKIDWESKRPDFIMYEIDGVLQIIEIKKPHYRFADSDCKRLMRYFEAFENFIKVNNDAYGRFLNKYHITLVCDGDLESLDFTYKKALENYRDNGFFKHISWTDFLARTQQMHEEFIKIDNETKMCSEIEPSSDDVTA